MILECSVILDIACLYLDVLLHAVLETDGDMSMDELSSLYEYPESFDDCSPGSL